MTPTDAPVVRGRGLRKRFGPHAVLDGLDMEVRAGARVAVLGLNGAGKTTLFRCLLGVTPFDGDLWIAGHDVRREGRAARAHLGYVPQRPPQFDGTLAEWVEFFSGLRNADPAKVAARLAELGLPLDAHGAKPVRALSGGMLQKALLGLALGADVELLLLDEPTANLDPTARREFLRALRAVDARTTILLASHRLADVEAVADEIRVLHGGQFAFVGRVDDLWARVRTEGTLWVAVPPEQMDEARRWLERHPAARGALGNGHALAVRVEHAARSRLVFGLRDAGIDVRDFWTEAPSLEEILEPLLRGRPEPAAGPAPAAAPAPAPAGAGEEGRR